MKSIVRNCLHYNNIFMAKESDRSGIPQFIIKSSSSEIGINAIKNELNGIEWYNNQGVEKLSILVEKEMPKYLRTKCLFIPGLVHPYDQGFSKNEKYIKLIIDHYCEIWPKSHSKNDLYSLHGDLSMCNVIFNKSRIPIIIDWEHFNLHSAPLGFDALNLLFEQTWIEYEITHNIDKIIINLVSIIQSLKNQNAIDKIFLESPLNKTINFINENTNLWGEQYKKLPILNFDDGLINQIDEMINKIQN